MNECWLTTVDNPFDPITQFDDWYRYDEWKGYHTCSYVARILDVSSDRTPEEINDAIEAAVDYIIASNPMRIYKKVVKAS